MESQNPEWLAQSDIVRSSAYEKMKPRKFI